MTVVLWAFTAVSFFLFKLTWVREVTNAPPDGIFSVLNKVFWASIFLVLVGINIIIWGVYLSGG